MSVKQWTFVRRAAAWRDRRRRAHRAVGDAWREAVPGEVDFWDRWLRSGGLEWQHDFAARLDPSLPLQPEVADLLAAPDGAVVRLLDVGAGPLTYLGKTHPRYTIEITAVDALGDDYNRSLDAAGIEPPVRTRRCETERLAEVLPAGRFDLAYARNTLDHSYDPVAAIRAMVGCVKPGCPVLLVHRRNEAETEDYHGLHQWNLMIDGGDLVVWRPGTRVELSQALAGTAVVESTRAGDGWEYVVLRRAGGSTT